MSASPTDIEAGFLLGIWAGSLGLLAVSIVGFTVVILRRAALNQADRASETRLQEIEREVRAILTGRSGAGDLPRLELKGADDLDRVIDLLLDGFRNIRGKRAKTLRFAVEEWDLEPRLTKAVRRGHRSRRIDAIALLSFLQTESSALLLLRTLRARDPIIKSAAGRALARRPDAPLIDIAIQELIGTETENADFVADTLIRFGERAVPTVRRIVENPPSSGILLGALRALAHFPNHLDCIDTASLLVHSDPRVRAAALHLESLKTGGTSRPVLERFGRDESPLVRGMVADVAGSLPRRKNLDLLVGLADDTDVAVRLKAEEALADLGPAGAAVLRALRRRGPVEGLPEAEQNQGRL